MNKGILLPWIIAASAFLFVTGCVAPEPALPAYDPEHVVIADAVEGIPDGSTKVVREPVADCGDVTVDVVSATTDMPKHFHRVSNEIAVFTEGSGVFTFEGRAPIIIKPGMVLFIPKNQVHSFQNTGGRYTVVRIFAPHFEVNDRIEIKDIKEKDIKEDEEESPPEEPE